MRVRDEHGVHLLMAQGLLQLRWRRGGKGRGAPSSAAQTVGSPMGATAPIALRTDAAALRANRQRSSRRSTAVTVVELLEVVAVEPGGTVFEIAPQREGGAGERDVVPRDLVLGDHAYLEALLACADLG